MIIIDEKHRKGEKKFDAKQHFSEKKYGFP